MCQRAVNLAMDYELVMPGKENTAETVRRRRGTLEQCNASSTCKNSPPRESTIACEEKMFQQVQFLAKWMETLDPELESEAEAAIEAMLDYGPPSYLFDSENRSYDFLVESLHINKDQLPFIHLMKMMDSNLEKSRKSKRGIQITFFIIFLSTLLIVHAQLIFRG